MLVIFSLLRRKLTFSQYSVLVDNLYAANKPYKNKFVTMLYLEFTYELDSMKSMVDLHNGGSYIRPSPFMHVTSVWNRELTKPQLLCKPSSKS